MLYRAHRDIHLQLPADDMSVSLNILEASHSSVFRDQYQFDVERSKVAGIMTRTSLEPMLALTAHYGGEDGEDLLAELRRLASKRPGALGGAESAGRVSGRISTGGSRCSSGAPATIPAGQRHGAAADRPARGDAGLDRGGARTGRGLNSGSPDEQFVEILDYLPRLRRRTSPGCSHGCGHAAAVDCPRGWGGPGGLSLREAIMINRNTLLAAAAGVAACAAAAPAPGSVMVVGNQHARICFEAADSPRHPLLAGPSALRRSADRRRPDAPMIWSRPTSIAVSCACGAARSIWRSAISTARSCSIPNQPEAYLNKGAAVLRRENADEAMQPVHRSRSSATRRGRHWPIMAAPSPTRRSAHLNAAYRDYTAASGSTPGGASRVGADPLPGGQPVARQGTTSLPGG